MLILSPELCADFQALLMNRAPACPLIPAKSLKADVARVARAIAGEYLAGNDEPAQRAYAQVILARDTRARASPPIGCRGEGTAPARDRLSVRALSGADHAGRARAGTGRERAPSVSFAFGQICTDKFKPQKALRKKSSA